MEIYSLSKLLQSVARWKNSAFKSKLFTLPAISCIFFAIVSDKVEEAFLPPALFLSLTLNKVKILGWCQEVTANRVTCGLHAEGLGSLMWCSEKKVGFKRGNVFTIETADERKFIFNVSFSFQDGTEALGCHVGWYWNTTASCKSPLWEQTLLSSNPSLCARRTVLACSFLKWEPINGLWLCNCHFSDVRGDFIFLFSHLIPFFYIASDSNEKSQSCSFLCLIFKGQTLVLILSKDLEFER